jgi:Zn-dependent peptidase ImmA (M78 family)
MSKSRPAHVTPEVLRWARESIGYTPDEAARHIGVYTWELEHAESGDFELTLRQAENLADYYDRSLADLFLPAPPEEENQEALFRRLPGAPELPWPPAMRKLARHVRNRQDAAAEIYELLEQTPPWHEISALGSSPPSRLIDSVRRMLGVTLEQQFAWNDPKGYLQLRGWIDALEALGVLVMQDGTLPLEEMRGFVSLHDDVPVIVINTKDDPRARVFTLIHELGHLLRPSASEAWCNGFAAGFLMPEGEFREQCLQYDQADPAVAAAGLARLFGVTPLAAAVRIVRLGLIPEAQAHAFTEAVRSRHKSVRSGGGEYYRNKVTWLGPGFINLVLDAVANQAVSLSNAAGLLEAKVDHFPGLRQRIEDRTQLV